MKARIIDILNGIRPEVSFEVEAAFISNGLLDSFDLVALITELDEVFGVSIDGAEILPENFESVAAIEALLLRSGADQCA